MLKTLLILEARSVRESPRTAIVAIYRRKCRDFLSAVDWFRRIHKECPSLIR